MSFLDGLDRAPILAGYDGERRIVSLDIEQMQPGQVITITRNDPGRAELGHEWATLTITKPPPA